MLQETLSHLSQSWRLWLKISYESEKIETCFPVGSHFLRHYGVFFSPWKALIINILAVPESRKLTRPPLRKWVLIFDIILKAGHRNLPDCVDWLQKPWHTNIARRFRLIHSDGEIKRGNEWRVSLCDAVPTASPVHSRSPMITLSHRSHEWWLRLFLSSAPCTLTGAIAGSSPWLIEQNRFILTFSVNPWKTLCVLELSRHQTFQSVKNSRSTQ